MWAAWACGQMRREQEPVETVCEAGPKCIHPTGKSQGREVMPDPWVLSASPGPLPVLGSIGNNCPFPLRYYLRLQITIRI